MKLDRSCSDIDNSIFIPNNIVDVHLSDHSLRGRFGHLRSVVRPKVKRLLDFSVSVALLIAILPLFLLILLALVGSGQFPFYSHPRIGWGGREFGCLKFRTMRSDAGTALTALLECDPEARNEWEANHKLRKDPRITRIGRFLRATSLDELPQLFNIIVGQMSLVGPRPVTSNEFSKFYSASDLAAFYCSVRPGLTGLWQVSGRSGTSFAARVALDAQYVQHLSLRTDTAILFRTLDVVIRRKGAW